MASALYGPAGFYTSGGRAGRRGDFITSPEVGPLFGAVVARFLDAEWERLGRPDAVHRRRRRRRARVRSPDRCWPRSRRVATRCATWRSRSPSTSTRTHPAGVESVTELPDGPFAGVIIANELLDNLPFRLAVHDGGWREAYVVTLPDGSLVESLSAPFDPVPRGAARTLPRWVPVPRCRTPPRAG